MNSKPLIATHRKLAQENKSVPLKSSRYEGLRHSSISLKQMAGQSLAETLVVMLAILIFFTAIPWLGRLLDIGLNQANASAYAAFQYTRQLDGVDEKDIKERFFLGVDKNWRDRRQELLMSSERVHISVGHEKRLNTLMQPGMQAEHAQALREGWKIEDKGVVQARLSASPTYSRVGSAKTTALGLDLGFFDQLNPRLSNHTAILSDAAHASSDIESHHRTAWSNEAWGNATDRSYDLGRKIQSYAGPVDAGFDRAEPVFDWLVPWAGKLPGHHTQRKPFAERTIQP